MGWGWLNQLSKIFSSDQPETGIEPQTGQLTSTRAATGVNIHQIWAKCLSNTNPGQPILKWKIGFSVGHLCKEINKRIVRFSLRTPALNLNQEHHHQNMDRFNWTTYKIYGSYILPIKKQGTSWKGLIGDAVHVVYKKRSMPCKNWFVTLSYGCLFSIGYPVD